MENIQTIQNASNGGMFQISRMGSHDNTTIRTSKTSVFTENTGVTNDKEENMEKQEYARVLSEKMNEQINIYDSIVGEIKELYCGNVMINNKGVNKLNLKNIARGLFLNINKTISKKVRVLVIGDSSSGKSTFINWFLQEHIQKTGYEYETNNFTLITSGNYISEFNGDVTVKTYDFLKTISNRNKNFKSNLCTKMYINKSIETKNIDFIDTPGLKDVMNNIEYDINSIIYDLSDFVDIILIFFDSCGKSLTNRLILIIKEIHEKHMEKIVFVFSKIDEIKQEEDRIKLLCQTTQCLASKINIRSNIDLLPIYIYGAKNGKYLFENAKPNNELCIVNRINDIIKEIKKLFFKKLKKDLYGLTSDCDHIINKILEVLKTDNERRIHNTTLKRERFKHTIIQIIVFFFFLFFLLTQFVGNEKYSFFVSRYIRNLNTKFYVNYIKSTSQLLENWDNSYLIVHGILFFFFFMSGLMKKKFSKKIHILQNSSKDLLREQLAFAKLARERGMYLTKTFYELHNID